VGEFAEVIRQTNEKVTADGRHQLPTWWEQGDTARFLYEFEDENAVDKIKKHISKLDNIDYQVIIKNSAPALNNGVVYQLGRDKNFRPLIIIDLYKLAKDAQSQSSVIDALLYLLIMVREIMCMPYYVERWNLLIANCSKELITSQKNILASIEGLISSHFPSTLEKVFFLNCDFSEDFIDKLGLFQLKSKANRRVVVQGKPNRALEKYIAADQLEAKFNGTIPNQVETYFPPLVTSDSRTIEASPVMKFRKLAYFRMTKVDIHTPMFSKYVRPANQSKSQTKPLASPPSRPVYVEKVDASSKSGVAYIKQDHKYYSYTPGKIETETDYDDGVKARDLGATLVGFSGMNRRTVERKSYVVNEGNVKKLIEVELEKVTESPFGAAGSSAQDVYIHGVDRARAIKKWHNPVVSDTEKKKIESMDKRSIFSFMGCLGGSEKAFF